MLSKIHKIIKNKIYKNIIILILSLVISLFVFSLLLTSVYGYYKCKNTFESDAISIYDRNSSNTFSIDKMVLYSSANATNNETKRDLWDLNIYQFTDIAIFINNNSTNSLNSENTIKELYIDNINFGKPPEKGTPELYYKNIKEFATTNLIEENKITDSLNYNIINSNDTLDTSKPNYYNTCQIPVTIEYVNTIKENAIIPNDGTNLKFDGSLLQKANIPLNSINCNLNFNINIINNLDEKFVCKVNVSIPLEENENNIYNGFIKKELVNIPNSNFFKIM